MQAIMIACMEATASLHRYLTGSRTLTNAKLVLPPTLPLFIALGATEAVLAGLTCSPSSTAALRLDRRLAGGMWSWVRNNAFFAL
jgi:hypothetical protein